MPAPFLVTTKDFSKQTDGTSTLVWKAERCLSVLVLRARQPPHRRHVSLRSARKASQKEDSACWAMSFDGMEGVVLMVWEWDKRLTHMAPPLTHALPSQKPETRAQLWGDCTWALPGTTGTAAQGSMQKRASEEQKAGPGGSPSLWIAYTGRF